MTTRPARSTPALGELIVALALLTLVAIGSALHVMQLDLDPVTRGLILTSLSGIGGMAGFLGAFMLRVRSWTAFGVRSSSFHWMKMGVFWGILAFLMKGLAIMGYIHLTGDQRTIQDVFAEGAGGGICTAVAATFLLGVMTPIGEELLFRGVVTTVLLRHGAFCGVVGSALIFALFHGINMIFPAALVTGLIAGEIFRRSGSIWPAVVVHMMVNLPTIPIMMIVDAGQ